MTTNPLFPSESLYLAPEALNPSLLSVGRVVAGATPGQYLQVDAQGLLTSRNSLANISFSNATFSGITTLGPIFASNGVGLANSVLVSTGNGIAWAASQSASLPSGIITGTGIVNYYAIFNSENQIQAGNISDDGSTITVYSQIQFNDSIFATGNANFDLIEANTINLNTGIQISGNPGTVNQLIASNGSSTIWTSQVPSSFLFGNISSSLISGHYTNITKVGLLEGLDVTGTVSAASFEGSGLSLSDLDASQLVQGTVPSDRISGSYSGITSVGTLSQLRVTGISTVSDTFLSGRVYASGNPGLANSVLVSTGSGVAWGSLPVGIITGTGVNVDRIAKFVAPNQIEDSNISDDGSTVISLLPFEAASVTAIDSLQVGGFLYDANTSAGSENQILSSNGSNVVWTSQVPSSFLVGNIPSDRVSGTYSGITSVGNLDQLKVIGITTSAQFYGNGSNLTNLNANNLSDGTVPSARISGAYSGISSVGTLGILRVTGITTAAQFFGSGGNLTNLNASNLASGTVPSARISGTYSGITSVGTLAQLRVTGITTSTQFFGNGSNLTNINANNLSDGTVPSARVSGAYSGITSVGTLESLNIINSTNNPQLTITSQGVAKTSAIATFSKSTTPLFEFIEGQPLRINTGMFTAVFRTRSTGGSGGTDTGGYTDITDAVNNGAANIFGDVNADNRTYFGCFHGMPADLLTMSSAAAGGVPSVGGTIVWERWNGSAWQTFSGPTFGSDVGFVISTAATSRTSINGVSAFWFRATVTVAFTTAPVARITIARMSNFTHIGAAGGLVIGPSNLGNNIRTSILADTTPAAITVIAGGNGQQTIFRAIGQLFGNTLFQINSDGGLNQPIAENLVRAFFINNQQNNQTAALWINNGNRTQNNWAQDGVGIRVGFSTYTVSNGTAAGSHIPNLFVHSFGTSVFAAANTGIVVTSAASAYFGEIRAGSNVTIANPYSIITEGNVRIPGLAIGGTNLPANTQLIVSGRTGSTAVNVVSALGTSLFTVLNSGDWGFGTSAAPSTGWSVTGFTERKTLTGTATTTEVRDFIMTLAQELIDHGIIRS